MAVENNDLVVLQKNGGGELRKATVSALLAGASTTTPDLQAVTDQGNTTTKGATFGDNVVIGQSIFSGPVTNVGVEANAEKGALHIRAANNTAISALEIISAGSQLSHYKVLGSGDLKIGTNVNTDAGTAIELNPDGSATFATDSIELKANGSATFSGTITAAVYDIESLPELP